MSGGFHRPLATIGITGIDTDDDEGVPRLVSVSGGSGGKREANPRSSQEIRILEAGYRYATDEEARGDNLYHKITGGAIARFASLGRAIKRFAADAKRYSLIWGGGREGA